MTHFWLSLFIGLSGPFIGSFISASALSWPRLSNLFISRSSCTHCQRTLTITDLIPIISFLALKGSCRNCKTPIDRQHFYAEILSTLIALVSIYAFSGWMMLVSMIFGGVLLFITLVDMRTRLIPDGASFFLIFFGAAHFFWQDQQAGLITAFLGGVIGYGFFWGVAFFYRHVRGREGLGLGDAKLLAAGGAWLGPLALPWIVLLAASSALFTLLITHKGKLSGETELPFGPALAFAIFTLWIWFRVRTY